ncbi:lecithin retinol acyltransferase-like [Prunus avium]|uniref:Lecithin retinol acyltransferase-like n=1 Tax=Prunus avium TaxID=42229 RepID=A0A6P5TW12_PRUAV|nr:lecithin retinol acyltransferase-like [Prunus avium]
MGIFSNKISREELHPGDHIYAYRSRHAYSHHGIFVGNDRVIHFTSTDEPKSSSSSTVPPCGNCGHDPNTKRGVLRTCIDCFLKDHNLLRFEYEVSPLHFIFKQKGTCSTKRCYSNDEIVCRATEIFNKDKVHGKGFGDYDLFKNNCENFASYCKRGTPVSEQARKAMGIADASLGTNTPSTSTSKTAMFLSIFASKSS